MRLLRDALLTTAAAAGTALTWRALGQQRGRPWAARWERTNHAGDPVTLLEGVALVVGTAGTAAASPRSPGMPFVLASVGAGALGALDDQRQDTDRKGLLGHLRALAQGRVTTGALKILGLSATGLVAVAWQDSRHAPSPDTGQHARPTNGAAHDPLSTLVGGAVVAGSANLANLFDLRPGRALKVGILSSIPLLLSGPGSPGAAITLGSSAALLPDDLAGRSMLGDTGANPLGAALGLALVKQLDRRGRLIALAALTALTLASERVSFTRVIESTPVLRELDAWGRPRPPAVPGE